MANVNIIESWAGRLFILIILVAVHDSFTKAMGFCHYHALIQSTAKVNNRFRSSENEIWIKWNYHLYLPQNKTKMTWENADLECKRIHQDAHLIYIESEEENEFVFSSLSPLFDEITWIGISDEDEEGSWKWGRKTPPKFINWGSAEPNGGLNENCGGTFFRQNLGTTTWFDISCTSEMYFICERG